MNLFDLHPVFAVVGIPFGLAAIACLIVVAGRALERKYTDRKMAAKFAAGALADPHGDYSIFSRPNDPEDRLQVVHRYMPDVPLGTVTAAPSGFLSQYGEETPELHPNAEQATHAIAARHVEIQPMQNLERRLTQTHADELAKFKKSPRG